MGFRTVVVLSNDNAHEWENDPKLGHKIWMAAVPSRRGQFEYGSIIEQVHADSQTMVVLNGYDGHIVADTFWYRNQTEEARNLSLLKQMADKLGYRVIKKSAKKV